MLFIFKKIDDPERFGVAELNGDNNIKKIEEKPRNPKSNYAVTGLYLYDKNIFQVISYIMNKIGYSKRGELEITDVNNHFVKNYKTKAVMVDGFWSDAGTFKTLIKSSNFIYSMVKNNKRIIPE